MTTSSDTDSSNTSAGESAQAEKVGNIRGADVGGVDQPMSLGDHFQDLRNTVIRSIAVPILVFFIALPFWAEIHHYLVHQLLSPSIAANLSINKSFEGFSVGMTLPLYVAMLVGLPWVLLNFWFFVSPGLYPHERRFARLALPLSVGLFFAGVAFGLYVVVPMTMDFLLNFGIDEVPKANYSVGDFYGLAFMLFLVLGICFQTPLLVAPAVRFGVLKMEHVKGKRRVIYFGIAVLAAIITPTGDPVTMLAVTVPLVLLLELGLILGQTWKKVADKRAREEPQSIEEGWREGLSGLRAAVRNPEEGILGGKAADGFADTIGGMARRFAEGLKESGETLQRLPDDLEKLDQDRAPKAVKAPSAPTTKDQLALEIPGAPPAAMPKPAPDPAPEGKPAVVEQAAPAAAITPKAPLAGVASESQIPEHLLDPNRPVPQLPRELRRRIDHYIHSRLEELLAEVMAKRETAETPQEGGTDGEED